MKAGGNFSNRTRPRNPFFEQFLPGGGENHCCGIIGTATHRLKQISRLAGTILDEQQLPLDVHIEVFARRGHRPSTVPPHSISAQVEDSGMVKGSRRKGEGRVPRSGPKPQPTIWLLSLIAVAEAAFAVPFYAWRNHPPALAACRTYPPSGF